MAKDYLPVDRDQGFLLPPDMRDWLPADHQVWLLIDVVDKHLDTGVFHARSRLGGVGRAGYDPDMLLTLLIWAYAQGVRSSRRIERLCRQDLAFRIICGGRVPDHTRIARFRGDFAEPVTEFFTQVLKLCAGLGMGALGTITLDGTKVTANASKSANRGRDWLADQARHTVAEHADTDAEQDLWWGEGTNPDVVPADLVPTGEDAEHDDGTSAEHADPGPGDGRGGDNAARRRGRAGRAARIAQAYAQVQAEQAERRRATQAKAEEAVRSAQAGTPRSGRAPAPVAVDVARAALARAEAAQQKRIDDWNARVAARGRHLPGLVPQPVEMSTKVRKARERLERAEERQAARERNAGTAAEPPATRNITDPDSRFMPTRSGFVQGYNAQTVVTADGLILATALTQTPGDVTWLQPMTTAAQSAADLVTAAHAGHAAAHDLPCTCPGADADADADAETSHGDAREAAGRGPRCRRHPDRIGILLADAGYLSRDNLTAPGPDRLIAVGKHRDLLTAANAETGNDADGHCAPEPDDPIAAMAQRLRTPEGITAYNQRGHIAETPHGHIKHNLGFRQFSLRGLTKATAEWTFVCAVANLFKALPDGPTPLINPTG